jgi:hypothetical protein
MKTSAAAVLLVLCGCQTYDFEPVKPIALAQTVKEEDITARPAKPNLFLVLDKSGSMRDPVDPTCTGTCIHKIDALQQSMDTFLTQSGSTVHLGMVAFPSDPSCGSGDLAMGVPLDTGNEDDARLAAAANGVKGQIDALSPEGGTPTDATLQALVSYAPLQVKNHSNYAVLLTDGLPNCNPDLDASTCTCTLAPGTSPCKAGTANGCLDDTGSAAAVAALKAKGVETIIIGFGADVAGSTAGATLATMAAAGGFTRPCTSAADCDPGDSCNPGGLDPCGRAVSTCGRNYFQASSGTDLGKALDAIQRSITCPVCLLPLSSPPSDPKLMSVIVNGVALPPGQDTWVLDETEVTAAIEFKGATCDEMMRSTADMPVHVEVRVVDTL